MINLGPINPTPARTSTISQYERAPPPPGRPVQRAVPEGPAAGDPEWAVRSWRRFFALLAISYCVPVVMLVASFWSYEPAAALGALGSKEPLALGTIDAAADALDALRGSVAKALPLLNDRQAGALNDELGRLSGEWETAAASAKSIGDAAATTPRLRPATLAAFYHLKAATVLQLVLAAAIVAWALIYLLSERKKTERARRKVAIGVAVAFAGAAVNAFFVHDLRLVDALSGRVLVPIVRDTMPAPGFGVFALELGLFLLALATGLTIVTAAFVASEARVPTTAAAAIPDEADGVSFADRLKTVKQVLILNALLFLATLLMLEMLAAFVTSTLPAEIGGKANPAATQLRDLLSAMNLAWALGFTAALAFIYIPAAAFLLPHVEPDAPKQANPAPIGWSGQLRFKLTGAGIGTGTLAAKPLPAAATEPAAPRKKPPDWSDGVLYLADAKVFGKAAQLATILSPALFKGFVDLLSFAT